MLYNINYNYFFKIVNPLNKDYKKYVISQPIISSYLAIFILTKKRVSVSRLFTRIPSKQKKNMNARFNFFLIKRH